MRQVRILLVISSCALLLGSSLLGANAEANEQANGEKSVVADHDAGILIVHAQGLTSDDGNLRFVLFDSAKNFLKRPIRAQVIEIDGRQGTWTVEDLPFGEYAVLVHHDSDASGKMERHWYGKPKEPTGASNDAPAKFGPPKFKKAKFQLESSELTLTITVK